MTIKSIIINQENIRYGREGVSKEEIVAAAKKAFAHDFISQLPDVSCWIIELINYLVDDLINALINLSEVIDVSELIN